MTTAFVQIHCDRFLQIHTCFGTHRSPFAVSADAQQAVTEFFCKHMSLPAPPADARLQMSGFDEVRRKTFHPFALIVCFLCCSFADEAVASIATGGGATRLPRRRVSPFICADNLLRPLAFLLCTFSKAL